MPTEPISVVCQGAGGDWASSKPASQKATPQEDRQTRAAPQAGESKISYDGGNRRRFRRVVIMPRHLAVHRWVGCRRGRACGRGTGDREGRRVVRRGHATAALSEADGLYQHRLPADFGRYARNSDWAVSVL